jgi:hypothetical protein
MTSVILLFIGGFGNSLVIFVVYIQAYSYPYDRFFIQNEVLFIGSKIVLLEQE